MDENKIDNPNTIVEGVADVDFKTKDGSHIQGLSVYLSMPITSNGKGRKFEKCFFSCADNRAAKIKATISIGDAVTPVYNRFGKVLSLAKATEDAIDFGD